MNGVDGAVHYLCLRRNVRGRDERRASLDAHLAWMQAQHQDGRILLSGPSTDRQLGIYLIRAATREEAARVAAADPFTAAGDATFELVEWELHQVLGVGSFGNRRTTD